jgi:glutaminase
MGLRGRRAGQERSVGPNPRVIPGKGGIGVFSPGLDRYGNSVRGTRVCAEISERLGLHVFATDAEDSLLGRAEPRA